MHDTLTQHITKTPDVCGGKACIAGHRIRVSDIVVWHERRGYSPDEIVDLFPGIGLADVFASLAYYFDNRDEIESELHGDQQRAAQMRSTAAIIASKNPQKASGE